MGTDWGGAYWEPTAGRPLKEIHVGPIVLSSQGQIIAVGVVAGALLLRRST